MPDPSINAAIATLPRRLRSIMMSPTVLNSLKRTCFRARNDVGARKRTQQRARAAAEECPDCAGEDASRPETGAGWRLVRPRSALAKRLEEPNVERKRKRRALAKTYRPARQPCLTHVSLHQAV
jgi:hypothetical protein